MKRILSILFLIISVNCFAQSKITVKSGTDTTGKWLNSFTRISGVDSFIFYIGGTRYAVKDSTGGGSGGGITSIGEGLCIDVVNDSTVLVDTACIATYFLRRSDSLLYVTQTKLNDTAAAIRSDFPAGGYTNLTQFVAQTAHRTFYSDASGDVQELAHGTAGFVLTSNGASANPSWQAAAGSLTVGTTPIASGKASAILFEGASHELQEDSANLWFDNSANVLYAKSVFIQDGSGGSWLNFQGDSYYYFRGAGVKIASGIQDESNLAYNLSPSLLRFDLPLTMKDISAPSTPASGYGALYVNTDAPWFKNDSGTAFEFLKTASVNSVSPTSPNRTITVVIGGTTYYIAAKTTND